MKRVVVTGATRGLGRAMVDWFAANDCQVFGCGRSETELARLRSEHPTNVFHKVDIADDEATGKWAQEIIGSMGPPDLLVNNAATIAPNSPLWKLSADQVDRVVRVNLLGTINVIRHFVPAMIKRCEGVIVNFSSGWGRSTSPEVATYCATKWAIEGLTQALSQELPEGVAAVALNPGIINTEMLQECFAESASAYPSAEEWVLSAGPYLLSLNAGHNGRSLTVPSIPTE